MATRNKKIYSGQLSQFDQNFFAYSSGLLSLFCFLSKNLQEKKTSSFICKQEKQKSWKYHWWKEEENEQVSKKQKTKQNKQYWNTKYGYSVTNLYHLDRAKYVWNIFVWFIFSIAASEFDSKTNEQQSNWNWTKQLMNWI